ncbi:MAG TPA: hypothetical protein VGU23_04615 [Acidobacteriaceae bacterium]|nr:hypothetical protein [Acidobacteriaceae bacterium]
MLRMKTCWIGACALVLLCAQRTLAQDARQIVQQAVNDQLAADRNDTSHWRYIETEIDRSKYVVVETENGAMRRHIDVNGQPALPQVLAQDDAENQRFIHDPALRNRQRQNSAHDDKDSIELLNLMPEAFVWTVEDETPQQTTLSFKPKPNFSPPDMEARVMGSMTGTLVVTNPRHRIKTFKGQLQNDVTIGFGLLARLKAGSTFDIERREVAPGYWQIVETHVHIGGHALFFKTIGTQEDEMKSNFTPVPPGTTLEQAIDMLKQPPASGGGRPARRR